MCKSLTTRQSLRAIVTMHDLNRLIHTPYWSNEAETTARVIARIVHRPLEWLPGDAPKLNAENAQQEDVTTRHPLPLDAQRQIFNQVQRVQMAVSMREPSAKALEDLIACVRFYTMEEGDL